MLKDGYNKFSVCLYLALSLRGQHRPECWKLLATSLAILLTHFRNLGQLLWPIFSKWPVIFLGPQLDTLALNFFRSGEYPTSPADVHGCAAVLHGHSVIDRKMKLTSAGKIPVSVGLVIAKYSALKFAHEEPRTPHQNICTPGPTEMQHAKHAVSRQQTCLCV